MNILQVTESKLFRKDIRRMQKRGKDIEKLKTLLAYLIHREQLPTFYQAHPLKGDWSPFYDAHIEYDWLLIYHIENETLYIARTGTHADIFG